MVALKGTDTAVPTVGYCGPGLAISGAGPVTHAKVTLPVRPPPSVAETVVDALPDAVGSPEMTPVDEPMDRPVGRPVADQV